MLKRVLDTRSNFKYKVDDKISSNFYPVTRAISIKDYSNNHKERSLNIYNNKSQSMSSLESGSIVIFMNRWSNVDDRKGLNTGIIENASLNTRTHIKHYISTSNINNSEISKIVDDNPLISVTIGDHSYSSHNTHNDHNNLIKIKGDCCEIDTSYSQDKTIYQIMNTCNPFFVKSKQCIIKITDDNLERTDLSGIIHQTPKHTNKSKFTLKSFEMVTFIKDN